MSKKDFLSVPTPGGLAPLNPNPVAMGTASATGNPRNKVALAPGYSLMDWIKLTKSGKDLAGTGGKILQVTRSELKKHNKRKDAWLALNGIVFNVTAYMDFHPGGWDELMKGAGKDATALFNKYHQWVNYESMLSACVVGKLVKDPIFPPPTENLPNSNFQVIPPIVPNTGPEKPKLDHHQTDTTFTLSIFTRRKKLLEPEHIIIDYIEPNLLHILLRLLDDQTAYNIAYRLEKPLDEENPFKVSTSYNSGKVEITLKKKSAERWNKVGEPLMGHDTWVPQKELPKVDSNQFPQDRFWRLVSKVPVTHDVDHYIFERPYPGLYFHVPVGHHVEFSMSIDVDEIEHEIIKRFYTPTFNDLENCDDEKDDTKLHFLIKTYSESSTGGKPGILTPALKELPLGAFLKISSSHLGNFKLSNEQWNEIENFYLLAAGTGITPMCKLIQSIHKFCKMNKKRRTVTLLNFNKTQKDIIWKNEFKTLEDSKDFTFKVIHILSQEDDWNGDKGRVRKEILEKYLPTGKSDFTKFAAICGPIMFNQESNRLLKEDFEFSDKEIWMFEG